VKGIWGLDKEVQIGFDYCRNLFSFHFALHVFYIFFMYCILLCVFSLIQWEVGDFIISDNLAVGHEATPETQLPVSKVGLRVLHRTTVAGKWIPQK
jgi:alpha-ketoglutarate-dependent taurine dioxygenase